MKPDPLRVSRRPAPCNLERLPVPVATDHQPASQSLSDRSRMSTQTRGQVYINTIRLDCQVLHHLVQQHRIMPGSLVHIASCSTSFVPAPRRRYSNPYSASTFGRSMSSFSASASRAVYALSPYKSTHPFMHSR